MKIGSINLNFPVGGMMNVLSIGFWTIISFVIVGVLSFFIWRGIRNKVVYREKVTLTIIYDNGSEKTLYGMHGGRYIGPNGAWEYKIKIPKQRKPKELGYIPNFSLADSDGTIHFVTCGDQTYWQQVSWRTQTKEMRQVKDSEGNTIKEFEYELLKRPIIGSDEKNIMIKDIKNWRDVVNKNKVTAFAIGLGMFLIMVIAHLVSLYIQTKIKCSGTP